MKAALSEDLKRDLRLRRPTTWSWPRPRWARPRRRPPPRRPKRTRKKAAEESAEGEEKPKRTRKKKSEETLRSPRRSKRRPGRLYLHPGRRYRPGAGALWQGRPGGPEE
ncbi:MAG: hypothetical protein V8S34_04490 [Lawsonibacter sp.]